MGKLKKSKMKELLTLWLLLIFLLSLLIVVLPVATNMMTKFGKQMDQSFEDIVDEENEKLKESFQYIGDIEYKVTDKNKSGVFNPLSGERTNYYYFVVLEDDIVYRLEVPAKLFNRVVPGEFVVLQEGADEGYLLSENGEDVVRKFEVKE